MVGCLGHGGRAIALGFNMCGYRCDRSVSGHQAVRDRGQPSPGLRNITL